jgi:hypothetical protein
MTERFVLPKMLAEKEQNAMLVVPRISLPKFLELLSKSKEYSNCEVVRTTMKSHAGINANNLSPVPENAHIYVISEVNACSLATVATIKFSIQKAKLVIITAVNAFRLRQFHCQFKNDLIAVGPANKLQHFIYGPAGTIKATMIAKGIINPGRNTSWYIGKFEKGSLVVSALEPMSTELVKKEAKSKGKQDIVYEEIALTIRDDAKVIKAKYGLILEL